MDVVRSEHIVGHVALIEIDVRPLSALSFVTGDGIGELHLQGVEITVGLQFCDAVCLERYIGIVFHHGIEELFLLFTGEGWCLGGEGIKEEEIDNYGIPRLVDILLGQLTR